MSIVFSEFQKTAVAIRDVSLHPAFSITREPASGRIYCDKLFIEYIDEELTDEGAQYYVCLWGRSFQGLLIDCEVELWRAAIEEGAI